MPNLQETIDSFFNSTAPGSLMLCLDPLHHYRPSLPNCITLYRGTTPGRYFRHTFVPDNVQSATLCSYVPDARLLRFDIPNPSILPVPIPMQFYTTYVEQKLLPWLEANRIEPTDNVSLRDAVFMVQRGELGTAGTLPKREDYREYISEQQDRERIYRCDPEFRTPLIVAQTEHGYLLFSDNPPGREGLRQYAWQVVNSYFNPHPGISFLNLYEFPYVSVQLVPLIDRSYTNSAFGYCHRFTHDIYIPEGQMPQGFTNELNPIIRSELAPNSSDFIHLAKYLHNWHRTQTQISKANMEIYRLLTIKETGYINIHSEPFSFDEAFRPLAEQLEQTTQVKAPEQLDSKRLEELMKQTRQLADHFLKDEFDVRGHRSVVRMLDDPLEKIVIGNTELPQAAKTALLDGLSLHIPADTKGGTPTTYAQLSEDRRSIFLSPAPLNQGIFKFTASKTESKQKKNKHTPHL